MQNWKKDRNYRKSQNRDGSFTYVITVDGETVEVSEEVYMAYSQADRRERYCAERESGQKLSLERMDEDNVPLEYMTDQHIESAEDAVIRKMLAESVAEAFWKLEPDERDLIRALVMDGVTEQEYAERAGVSQVAVHKRKKRLLKKISDFMVIKP